MKHLLIIICVFSLGVSASKKRPATSTKRAAASIREDLPNLVPLEKKKISEAVDLDQTMILESKADVKIRVKHFVLGQEEIFGEITGSNEEKKFFLPGDVIFVRSMDLSKFKVGTRLSVAKLSGDLEDKTVSKSLALGKLVELVGELEVLEWGEKFVKCEVHSVFGKMERGDKVTPLVPMVRLGEKIKPPTDLLLKVVMAEESGAKYSASGALVLLNKGWQNNVAPDQYFRVFSDTDPIRDSTRETDPVSKGEIQIVYAGKTASIGFVTKASRPIQLGDALIPYQHFSEPKPPPRKEVQTIEIN